MTLNKMYYYYICFCITKKCSHLFLLYKKSVPFPQRTCIRPSGLCRRPPRGSLWLGAFESTPEINRRIRLWTPGPDSPIAACPAVSFRFIFAKNKYPYEKQLSWAINYFASQVAVSNGVEKKEKSGTLRIANLRIGY